MSAFLQFSGLAISSAVCASVRGRHHIARETLGIGGIESLLGPVTHEGSGIIILSHKRHTISDVT